MWLSPKHVIDRVDCTLLKAEAVLNAKKADIHIDDLLKGKPWFAHEGMVNWVRLLSAFLQNEETPFWEF
jgi:hypothetical protein